MGWRRWPEIDARPAGVQQVPHSRRDGRAHLVSGRNRHLLLSVHARHACAHLSPQPAGRQTSASQPDAHGATSVDEPSAPPPGWAAFCMLLRKHLKGAILVAGEIAPTEAAFYRYAETEVCLVLEAMGKHSNLMLSTPKARSSIHQAGEQPRVARPFTGVPTPCRPPAAGRSRPPPGKLAALLQRRRRPPGRAPPGRLSAGSDGAGGHRRRCDRADPTCLAGLRAVADPAPRAGRAPRRGVPVGFLRRMTRCRPVDRGARRQCQQALAAYFAYRIAHEVFEGGAGIPRALDDAVRSQRRIREAEEGTGLRARLPT